MASEDRPNYKIAIAKSFPEISVDYLRPKILLSAKIDMIAAHLKTGTLIYTHYVEDTRMKVWSNHFAAVGYKVGLFTGVEKPKTVIPPNRNSSPEKSIFSIEKVVLQKAGEALQI